jgi:heme-degrading monooxygenase HmoA
MPALPWVYRTRPPADRDCVMMASVLPLAGFRYLPAFLGATRKIRKQLATADGLIGYSLDAHPLAKMFWTLSAWESREALDAFSRADPHRTEIAGIRPHMRPTTFVFWDATVGDLPGNWADARRRVAAATS